MQSLNIHCLRRSLDNLCKFLDDEYSINCGGCCYIALLIAKHLDKLNISYKLIVFDSCKKDELYINHEVVSRVPNRHRMKSIVGRNNCSHYCLEIEGAGIVNEGHFTKRYHRKYSLSGVHSKHIRWIYGMGRWNRQYQTNDNQTVKNIVKTFFKQYESISINKSRKMPKMSMQSTTIDLRL